MNDRAVPTPQRRPRSAVVLTGGGARGAYQVGVLKAVAAAVGPGPSAFPIISGLSVGAINAAALAADASDFPTAVARLEALWRSLDSSRVFRTDAQFMVGRVIRLLAQVVLGRLGVATPPSLLDNGPLHHLLRHEIDRDGIDEALASGALDALAVTVSSYITGQAVTFVETGEGAPTWARSRRTGRARRIGADVVLASSALPFVFPAVQIGADWFGDGALRQTSPLSPAIHLGADRIFTIANRDPAIDPIPTALPSGPPERPTLGILAGQLLDILFNDGLESDLERLERINATLETMLPERREASGLRRIETLTITPSEDIRAVTARYLGAMPWTVKLLIRTLGGWKSPYVLPSYLMFERPYIADLIALGEADGKARADEIAAFLMPDRAVA
ncbi:MAG: patatin-like phospholipase family protein [Pseudomonadota bacterium]